MLVNIATGNAQLIAALFGPVHGIAWLFGILTTWHDPRRSVGAVMRAVIPGLGGLLALRALNRADAGATADTGARTR
jgi:hypothetical protein